MSKFTVQLALGNFCWCWLLIACLATPSKSFASDPGTKPLPAWKDVAAYVERHFQNFTGYQAGDIISTSNVTPLFDGLDKLGWDVATRKSILEKVPADNDFVVKQLRTPEGTKFMRQISKYPMCYDRLYHLAAIPRGRQQVHGLIAAKDGYKMIEYMTTSQQGKNLGVMLSQDPNGANFNQPVDKIFTAETLLSELHKAYDAAVKAAAN